MDKAQLLTQLQALGVIPVDVNRAAIYLRYLTDAKTYFTQTLSNTVINGGIGAAAFQFSRQALGSSSLLQELSEILDLLIGEALNKDLMQVFQINRGYTYDAYFTNTIYAAGGAQYQNNVTNFFARYTVARDALDQAAQNFRTNIRQACERAYADRAVLALLYQAKFPNNPSFLRLTAIKSTGSDFHKGGQQVLILSFRISYQIPVIGPQQKTLKVVYKPGDLEADCLLAGDAAAVNRALHPVNFMVESLFELYNSELAANPVPAGQPLPTYLILPRVSQSGLAPAYQVRGAYGYLEYLDNDVSTPWGDWWGYYPWASSDFIIFHSEDPVPIVSQFYQLEGAFSAIASTFSIVDLHVENLRVMARKPFLIDMEACLTVPVDNDVGTTALLGNLGGITGIRVDAQDFKWKVVNPDVAGQAFLDQHFNDDIKQNRLWTAEANHQRRLVPVDPQSLLQGFDAGMAVLRALVEDVGNTNRLTNWIARLNNVVVRVLPYSTAALRPILKQVFVDPFPYSQQPHLTTAQAVAQVLSEKRTLDYGAYTPGLNPAPDPKFLVLTGAVSGADYQALDIPIFYHRLGRTDIVNSQGVVVPIPPTIQIITNNNPNLPLQNVPVTGIGGVFNRNTYYLNPPFANLVQANQITPLGAGNNAFINRVQPLRASIQACFQPPRSVAATIVPFT